MRQCSRKPMGLRMPTPRRASGPQRATISWFDGRCISLHRANTWWAPFCASFENRRRSQIPARRADWLCCCSGRRRAKPSPPVRQVLVLQSFDRGNLVVDHFTGNFRVELDQRAGQPVNVVQVVVGPTGFVGAPEQAVVDYIRSTFADRPKPDLIVTVAGPAAVFARKYRQQLFPDTPLLFASVDQRYLRRRAAWGERDRRRGRQRFSASSSMTSCSCCPRPGRCSW